MYTKIIVLEVTASTQHSSRQAAKVTQGYSGAVTGILLNPYHLGWEYFSLMSAFWNSLVSILWSGTSNGARTVYAYFFYLEKVQTSCSVYITHIYNSLPHGRQVCPAGKAHIPLFMRSWFPRNRRLTLSQLVTKFSEHRSPSSGSSVNEVIDHI